METNNTEKKDIKVVKLNNFISFELLRKMKENRGYIDFGIDEAKIVVDEKGKAIDIVKRYRGEGENLIEDFMIAANETVATHIYYMNYKKITIPVSTHLLLMVTIMFKLLLVLLIL